MVVIHVPTLSVNEDAVKLVKWTVEPGKLVKKNEIINFRELTIESFDYSCSSIC